MNAEKAVEELLRIPVFADSDAKDYFETGEIAQAAAWIALEFPTSGVSLSEAQRLGLVEGLREYAHGDRELFSWYAQLLDTKK